MNNNSKVSFFSKLIIAIIYFVILLIIPLFIDFIISSTSRKKRKENIIKLANDLSNKKNKSLVIFDGVKNGIVIDNNNKKEIFSGDIFDFIFKMSENSCVVVASCLLEHVDNNHKTEKIIEQLIKISGGDLFVVCYDKYTPRFFWDPHIYNEFEKQSYLPKEEIKWKNNTNFQKKTKNCYSYFFDIFPYEYIWR